MHTSPLFLGALATIASAAAAAHGAAPAPDRSAPRDHNLHAVRDLLAKAETESVAIVILGDSRSSYSSNRVPGAIYRHWDVPWAALYIDGVPGAAGMSDGLGQFYIGLDGISMTTVIQGATSPDSGLTNRWPVILGERWVIEDQSGHSPETLHFATVLSTSGGTMWSSSSGTPGGTFKRGDPAQGRNITSLEYFAVTNNSPSWLPVRVHMGYGGSETNALGPVVFDAPLGPTPQHTLQRFVAPGPNTTGTRIGWRFGHTAPPPLNHGHIWAGSRVNFQGGAGCILGVVAQGGWSTSDHLPQSVYTLNDNWDWKYADDQFVEWYETAIRAPRVLVRIEIGANQNVIGGNFHEWNGINIGNFKNHVRMMGNRAINNLAAAGAQEVVVQLVSIWTSGGQGGNIRDPLINDDLYALALEHGWAFYDQQGHLETGGHTENDGELRIQYRMDVAHQNFAGMNLLGQLEWQAISSAPDPCYANCDASTLEPILNVDDFTCFINLFAYAQSLPHQAQLYHYANCDASTVAPVLNVDDFTCFINAFTQGCP